MFVNMQKKGKNEKKVKKNYFFYDLPLPKLFEFL